MDERISFFLRALDLKDVPRTGWLLREVTEPESVADHSWGTALLCLVYGREAGVAVDHAVRIAIVHDLAESITGDIARRVNPDAQTTNDADKARLERAAMDELVNGWEGQEIYRLWQEYEDRASAEARFVRDMNLVDMCLQALKYEQESRYDGSVHHPNFPDFPRLSEFFATSAPRLSTSTGKQLFDRIKRRYDQITEPRR